MPLPSEDPEYKNISLNLFSADIINNIGVNKTFNSNVYGDVGGANIDIVSKELNGEQLFEVSVGTGVNTSTLNKDVLAVDGANWFGKVSEPNHPITDVTKYDFAKSYMHGVHDTPVNMGVSVLGGKTWKVKANDLSLFVIGSFDSDYAFKEGQKASASKDAVYSEQDFAHSTYRVSQLGMANLNYRFGKDKINNLAYNAMIIANNRQRVSKFEGQDVELSDEADESILARRQQENKNVLMVHQLLSRLTWGKVKADLGLSYNNIKGNEPDRRSSLFILKGGNYTVASEPTKNSRYYSELKEDDVAGRALFSLDFGKELKEKQAGTFTFGYNSRFTSRDVEYFQFNHNMQGTVVIDPFNPDEVFSQNGLNNGYFYLEANVERDNPFRGESYSATRSIHSGILEVTYGFNSKLTVNLGLRYDKVYQDTDWDTKINAPDAGDGVLDKNYSLPSLNLKYDFKENSIVRFAFSNTYTMPQFKEVALFDYEDVDFVTRGNPDLQPSTNYNFDVKWERYFKPGELLAVAGFYKVINDPINRTSVASAASTLSYLNSGDRATVAGVELEFRKKLLVNNRPNGLNKLQMGFNASYLYSKQDLSDPTANFTNTEDALQGASPILLNSDLTYSTTGKKVKTTSSLVVNYFSDRVYSIGTEGVENVMEKGLATLDFVFKSDLGEHTGIKFKAANLLNPEYKLVQQVHGISDEAIVNSFKRGTSISIGITYKF